MNFCGGSWYGVFVLKTTGIDGGGVVEEDAAMSELSSRRLCQLWKKICRPGYPAINMMDVFSKARHGIASSRYTQQYTTTAR